MATAQTRLARVRAILDDAAGDSASDYGGAGRFWNEPLESFLAATVFGVAMIAPPQAGACGCSSKGGRGEASGLVKGLRGEAPFDGVRFPPLPWGGRRVAADDIDFISAWIDDDCPEDDRETLIDAGTLASPGPARELVRVSEIAEFPACDDDGRPVARAGAPRQRMNLDCMSPPQVERLRRGFRKLYDLNHWPEDRRSYNNQALIHQNHCQHGWERFLPWHRAYLYEFEQNLQDFEPGLMLPYWDWTMPQYRPETPDKGWIIPQSMQAFLAPDAAEALVAALEPAPTEDQARAIFALAEDGTLFVSQHAFFCHLIGVIGYTAIAPSPADANRRACIDALLASNPLWYPLRYPAEYQGGGTINQIIHYHYPTARDMAQIESLNNFRDFGGGPIYDSAFGFLDQNPHNTMHIWTGGQNPDFQASSYACGASPPAKAVDPDLGRKRNAAVKVAGRRFHAREDLYSQPALGDMFSNLTASYDPVFWPIHVNIDRVWWEWQQRNPSAAPVDQDAVLSPWNYTVRDTLDMARFGYEYVRGSHFMPVGLEATVGRFVSAPLAVGERVKAFRRAEIRLHEVPQLARSCFVRAFLNDPAANASTPVTDNPHYAGYLAIFGHGDCYGGPGHCDLPPARPRDYDLRARSHNTPRNHRIDVTEAARALLAKADALQITLVVIGADYREDTELLKLEGVSLSFLD
ncbi:MAG TPA: tyrosinase family protein [Caulobacteraceae bacterium]|nr:tyrosinase family protein [Caulobacteraceae bacterium]